jgi:hypothetical protein
MALAPLAIFSKTELHRGILAVMAISLLACGHRKWSLVRMAPSPNSYMSVLWQLPEVSMPL